MLFTGLSVRLTALLCRGGVFSLVLSWPWALRLRWRLGFWFWGLGLRSRLSICWLCGFTVCLRFLCRGWFWVLVGGVFRAWWRRRLGRFIRPPLTWLWSVLLFHTARFRVFLFWITVWFWLVFLGCYFCLRLICFGRKLWLFTFLLVLYWFGGVGFIVFFHRLAFFLLCLRWFALVGRLSRLWAGFPVLVPGVRSVVPPSWATVSWLLYRLGIRHCPFPARLLGFLLLLFYSGVGFGTFGAGCVALPLGTRQVALPVAGGTGVSLSTTVLVSKHLQRAKVSKTYSLCIQVDKALVQEYQSPRQV